jgi:hypothetical protein
MTSVTEEEVSLENGESFAFRCTQCAPHGDCNWNRCTRYKEAMCINKIKRKLDLLLPSPVGDILII